MNKSFNEIQNDLKDVKHNFKYEMMQNDHKWDTRTKDMEQQFMKDMYEMDKKLLMVVDKVKDFSLEIKNMNLEISKMQNEIDTQGMRNEMMVEKAKVMVETLAVRMQNIDQSLKLAQSIAETTEERLALKARESLLELEKITIDQQNALKEIAYAEKGMEVVQQDAMNRLEEKRNQLEYTRNEIKLIEEKIKIISQQAEKDAKHQQQLQDLNDELYWEKQAMHDQEKQYRDMKNQADYWKQEHKKASRSTYRNTGRFSDYT